MKSEQLNGQQRLNHGVTKTKKCNMKRQQQCYESKMIKISIQNYIFWCKFNFLSSTFVRISWCKHGVETKCNMSQRRPGSPDCRIALQLDQFPYLCSLRDVVLYKHMGVQQSKRMKRKQFYSSMVIILQFPFPRTQ